MIAQSDVPQSQAAVVETIEGERRKIREWAERAHREVDAERDGQLQRLDAAVAALDVDAALSPPPPDPPAEPEPKPKPPAAKPQRKAPKPKRRLSSSTSPAAAAKRKEAVYELLCEQTEPIAAGKIRAELGLSANQAKTATRRLEEEGRAKRSGTGSTTKYEAVKAGAESPTPPPADPPPAPSAPKLGQPESNGHGTLQGRMLSMVEGRGATGVSLSEMVAELDAPQDEIVRELGALIREGEIKLARKSGQSVYVPAN